MNVRVLGSRREAGAVVDALRAVFDVRHVSGEYPTRAAGQVRVYVAAALWPRVRPVRCLRCTEVLGECTCLDVALARGPAGGVVT